MQSTHFILASYIGIGNIRKPPEVDIDLQVTLQHVDLAPLGNRALPVNHVLQTLFCSEIIKCPL